MHGLALAAAGLSWLGVTLLALSDERRGGALGLALAGLGLAAAEAATGSDPLAPAALGGGGLVAAALRLRGYRPARVALLSGSTPRLMGSIVVLVVVGLVGGVALGAPGGIVRLAAVAVSAVAVGRVLTTSRRWVSLAAGSVLALSLGAMGGLPAVVAGAVVAGALGAIDGGEAAEAR
jgi:hypothetical protein